VEKDHTEYVVSRQIQNSIFLNLPQTSIAGELGLIGILIGQSIGSVRNKTRSILSITSLLNTTSPFPPTAMGKRGGRSQPARPSDGAEGAGDALTEDTTPPETDEVRQSFVLDNSSSTRLLCVIARRLRPTFKDMCARNTSTIPSAVAVRSVTERGATRA
jgi:hypothetical protein